MGLLKLSKSPNPGMAEITEKEGKEVYQTPQHFWAHIGMAFSVKRTPN